MGLGPIISGLGFGLNAFAQGQAAKEQGEFQKQQYEANAQIADMQASDAIKRGDVQASDYSKKAGQVLGAQRSAYAGQGVDVNSGSAAAIQDETQNVAARDIATIKSNAWREAWGFRSQATSMRSQGAAAKATGDFTAGTTLLTGGLQILGGFGKAYDDNWSRK